MKPFISNLLHSFNFQSVAEVSSRPVIEHSLAAQRLCSLALVRQIPLNMSTANLPPLIQVFLGICSADERHSPEKLGHTCIENVQSMLEKYCHSSARAGRTNRSSSDFSGVKPTVHNIRLSSTSKYLQSGLPDSLKGNSSLPAVAGQ